MSNLYAHADLRRLSGGMHASRDLLIFFVAATQKREPMKPWSCSALTIALGQHLADVQRRGKLTTAQLWLSEAFISYIPEDVIDKLL